MKTSRKNALILTLGIIVAISFLQANVQGSTQQMSWYAGTQAVTSGGGVSAQVAWGFTAGIGYETTAALATAGAANFWNPAGWVCLGAAAVTGA